MLSRTKTARLTKLFTKVVGENFRNFGRCIILAVMDLAKVFCLICFFLNLNSRDD